MLAVGRFLLIVGLWHPAVVTGLAAVVVVAGALVAAGWMKLVDALAPVLLLQTLAVSSGFAGQARRGRYDYLFAAGHTRTSIAVAHWVISASPGVAGWGVLVLIEWASHGRAGMSSVPGGALTGLVFASTLPWAVTVPLPRLTGGIVWMVLLVTGITRTITVPPLAAVIAAAAAMVAAVVWIQRADFPLETAQ